MSIFGKLLKTAFDIATVPVDIVKDVVTMGGAMTEQNEPYTVKKIDRLCDDAEEIRDSLDDL